jgi:hypothetical protein
MNDELTQENFWAILASMPVPLPVYYRLYYNDAGKPLFYSHEDLPGKYIDIEPEQFALSDLRVKVINGILVPYQPPVAKLVPSDQGTPCDIGDVSIVTTTNQLHQRWKLRTHEQD